MYFRPPQGALKRNTSRAQAVSVFFVSGARLKGARKERQLFAATDQRNSAFNYRFLAEMSVMYFVLPQRCE